MPVDITIRGAESLGEVARALRAAGESGRGLRKELYRAIMRSTKPIKEDVKSSWRDRMPGRGGLARRPLSLRTRTNSGGARLGVRIVSSSKDGYDLGSINRGRLRHPVFGNRGAWASQAVPAGVITDPQEQAAPAVRDEIVQAIDRIRRQVEGT